MRTTAARLAAPLTRVCAAQGLLSTVTKSRDSHPPAAVRTLRFHVQDTGGGVRVVQQVLRTTGGDCRKVVASSLSDLFGKLGLPRAFRWGEGAWDVLSQSARDERDNRGGETSADLQHEQAEPEPIVAAQPTEASVPPAYDAAAVARPRKPTLRDAQGQPQDLAAALRSLDPLLNAIAAVPWLPHDAAGGERRHYIIHHALGELTAQGWALERGAAKVWAGARNADALAAEEEALGVDAASAQALKMVVFHARQLEKELGPP